MSEIDLGKYEKNSTLIWAVNNIRLPKAAPWDFTDRQWQLQLMDDDRQEIVVRKPTQVGLSTVMLTKMLHFADIHQCRATMTLPRQDDVYDMVNSRLSEIIQESPYIRDKMGRIDNVRMKRFGKSWLHFVEMSVPPRMMDVDWMLNDEVDLSNSEHLDQAISRMDASKFGIHHRISTPTIEGYGIDKLYSLSDQKQWEVQCGYCSKEQFLDWNLNVAHENNKTWYVCSRCQNPLHAQDIQEGHWVVTNPGARISGYQINQMMCTYIHPDKLWSQYETMEPKYFYNFKLGLPYSSSSGGFVREMIIDRCFNSGHAKEIVANSKHTYVLGADQGNNIHVVVGKIVDSHIEIVYLDEIPFDLGFDELSRIIDKFDIRVAVIDALPNHHSAKTISKNHPNVAYLAYFTHTDKTYLANEDESKISINKTDAYDFLLSRIANHELQFYGLPSPMDEQTNHAVAHLSNMRRDIEQQNTRAGGVKTFHVWKGIGPDHYADALVYMSLAADMIAAHHKSLDIFSVDSFMNGLEQEIEDGDSSLYAEVMRSLGLTPEDKGDPFADLPTNPYAAKKRLNQLLFR